jgi:release factor glutamine methyltransferase
LFVPNDSPLLFYETIAAFAQTHLKPNGRIYLEIHQEYAKQTAAIFTKLNKQVEIREDINGNERMIKVTPFPKQ